MKLSVVVAHMNSASTITDTLRSMLAQRGVEVEHIIVGGIRATRRWTSYACMVWAVRA
jgi:hypothetical protein